jgi:nitroreductase
MTDLFDVFQERRSIRQFKPEIVRKEDLKRILEAARLAPSANNRQPWRFIIVRDKFRKERLAKAACNQDFIAEADVIVVTLGDPQASPKIKFENKRIPHLQDPMIAVEHMVLAATALGYGTCWIGAFREKEVKHILKVPRRFHVISLLPIGVPAQFPSPRPRKEIREIVFNEEYGKLIEL